MHSTPGQDSHTSTNAQALDFDGGVPASIFVNEGQRDPDLDALKAAGRSTTVRGPSAGALEDAADPMLHQVLVALALQKAANVARARVLDHSKGSPLGLFAAGRLSLQVMRDPDLSGPLDVVAGAALAFADELLLATPSTPSEDVAESARLADAVADVTDAELPILLDLSIEASEPYGDVDFYAVSKYGGDGTPSHCEIGWGHAGRAQYGSDAEWSAFGWGLYEGGDLHDGHRSLQAVIDDLGPTVFLSIEDFKRDRGVPIERVIDAARAWAKLPLLAETPTNEISGDVEELPASQFDGDNQAGPLEGMPDAAPAA